MSDFVPTFIIETLLSDDGSNVSLRATARYVSESVCKPITDESIAEFLEQRGFGKFRKKSEQISEIVIALNEAIDQIECEEDTKSLSIETDVIAEALDAFGEVEVPDDKLQAVLAITPAEGGNDLTLTQAEDLLKEMGVTFGIDKTKLEALINKARDASIGEVCSDVVAVASMPVDGLDAQFIPLVDTANERILKPRLKEDGSVDMLDLGDIPTVAANTPLLKKVPPTEGEKGIDVCWGFLPPEPGKELDFKPGKGTKISDEDDNILVSEIPGQPNLLPRGMKVDDAVKVNAVDVATGHLNLEANLIVKGDILEGMKVRCKGDITVGGVIESADVKAKGNIIVGKGILGRTPDHSKADVKLAAIVESGGLINGMFASYAKLKAKEGILFAEQLLHCDTTSEGKVKVGNEKTVGSQIVGGITRSSVSIETDILGASAGVLTRLDLSGPFEVKSYELSCNHSVIEGKVTMLKNMRDAYSKFMNLQMTEARKEHMVKIKNTIEFLEKELKELEELNDTLKAEGEAVCEGLKVIAKRKIHPNVILKIAHATYKSTRPRESGELFYEGQAIHYNPTNISEN